MKLAEWDYSQGVHPPATYTWVREETTCDLVRDMIGVLTSMCARLYGRRGARNLAVRQ